MERENRVLTDDEQLVLMAYRAMDARHKAENLEAMKSDASMYPERQIAKIARLYLVKSNIRP